MPDGLLLHVTLERSGFTLMVDQTFPAQGITAVSGPSGSGKTTLLRIVAGLEERATGHVSLNGTVWQSEDAFVAPHKRRIGMVFQEPRLFPNMDVRANLLYGAKRAKLGWPDVASLVESLGIGHLLKRTVRGLSGGEQRRVALARALAMKPELLLLDEPLTGLDKAGKHDLLPFLCRAVAQAGCPALFVSHDAEEIAALSDLVFSLRAGRACGPLTPVQNCFDAPVVESHGDSITVRIGETLVEVPGSAETGTIRRLRIPMETCLLISERPRGHSGQACLAGRVTDLTERNARMEAQLDIGGETLRVLCDRNMGNGAEFEIGSEVWCVAMSVQVLPIREASGTLENR